MKESAWVGSHKNFVDTIQMDVVSPVVIGRFGGNSAAGQSKNEDGFLMWTDETDQWEFAVLLDAHHSAESAELIVQTFQNNKQLLLPLLSLTVDQAFYSVERAILDLFSDESFRNQCRNVKGEASCLILFRKNKYIWWFSVGDCIAYLFHSELEDLGQYELNQRQFYEWIGQINTFDLTVPCYSRGIRELREGQSRLFLTTDGLVECPNAPFSTPDKIRNALNDLDLAAGIETLLQTIRKNNVHDSTTILSWDVTVTETGLEPSV